MHLIKYLLVILFIAASISGIAQKKDTLVRVTTDSTTSIQNPALTKDTGLIVRNGDTLKVVPKHSPRKATLRSLILPGWGQAYNKRYWEIPIVYGALGATAAIYLYNDKWYKRTRDAYDLKLRALANPADSSHLGEIDPKLQPLSPNSLQNYRNSFRRDRDYSALWFVIFWGLNILDATVFAHLKDFDVSEDLSLRVNPIINQNGTKGVSLALGYKPPSKGHRYIQP